MRLDVLFIKSYNHYMPDRPESKDKETFEEKRRMPRIATSNFLGYACLDEDGEEISEGYGWTVNLSQSGARIETFRPIETRLVLLLSIDMKDELLEIKGEIVHTGKGDHRRYHYGIRFIETGKGQRQKISRFVKSYYQRDKTLAGQIDYERIFKERE